MIAAVVLAAGASSRMGHPKQLMRHAGKSLVRRTVEAVADGGCSPVVVVVGSSADAVRAEVRDLSVETVLNPGWRDGLGLSVRAGVAFVDALPQPPEAVLLTACDQPRLSAAVIERLVSRFDRRPESVVCCAYAGTVGVPALFGRAHFGELRRLSGDRGARALLRRAGASPVRIDWPEGEIDLDSPGDWDEISD